MLNEFDIWMEENSLSAKVRKDRWAWNSAIEKRRPITIRENRQWKPAVSYCRYADDFVVIVKGTKAHAEAIRERCRQFLGAHSMSAVDMVESLNRQITGWATFYQYTDYTATICCKADHALFWRFGHWLARKYKVGFRKLMPKFYKTLGNAGAKTWVVSGKPAWSKYFIQVALKKLVSSQKGQ